MISGCRTLSRTYPADGRLSTRPTVRAVPSKRRCGQKNSELGRAASYEIISTRVRRQRGHRNSATAPASGGMRGVERQQEGKWKSPASANRGLSLTARVRGARGYPRADQSERTPGRLGPIGYPVLARGARSGVTLTSRSRVSTAVCAALGWSTSAKASRELAVGPQPKCASRRISRATGAHRAANLPRRTPKQLLAPLATWVGRHQYPILSM